MTELADRLRTVHSRIATACSSAGRAPSSIEVVAVSKTHPVETIRAAYAEGLRVFGENYAQDLQAKARELQDLPDLRWRFIGHLQRNKAKLIERAAASVDTLDSSRLAETLSKRADSRHRPTEVLIQVNVGQEPQKSGCAPEDLPVLVDTVRALPGLDLQGLMTVAPRTEDPEDARPYFAALRKLAEAHGLRTLSMGMTHDLEAAVAEGSTMLRIGTAIFGSRQ
ncbi:MAG: YggS family pyridoxal phosphate-dependent enzyme [Polyangiales bacterium]